MNTCRCMPPSASLTTTHRVYLAGSGQSTLKLDARGRELAVGAKTRKALSAKTEAWRIVNHGE
jgi:hypothetical protein